MLGNPLLSELARCAQFIWGVTVRIEEIFVLLLSKFQRDEVDNN